MKTTLVGCGESTVLTSSLEDIDPRFVYREETNGRYVLEDGFSGLA
ncbi:hypothetical protein [Candidatus Halobonum tyrrellensis]|nr:hypothetical protein [Candidatus Halobonum tyrrellensis]